MAPCLVEDHPVPSSLPRPPPLKEAASRRPEIKAMTFYPTWDEFKNLSSYITYIESQGAHLAGIAKIVPPLEWKPRRSSYEPGELDIRIETPLRQTIAPGKLRGSFSTTSHVMPSLSVKEFSHLATRPAYVTPPHHTYEELEKEYWRYDRVDSSEDPIYGADVSASLTDPDCEVWNIARLESILSEELKYPIPGVNMPYLYFGMWKATFPWHVEDMDLYGVNYLHYGAPKTWYTVAPSEAHKLEAVAAELFPNWKKICYNFLRHKVCMISPHLLARYGVEVHKMVQEERDMMIVFPHAYHAGFNHGFNMAEAVNFALPRWVEYGKRFRACCCAQRSTAVDGGRLLMEPFIEKHQPDRLELWRKGADWGPHPEDPPDLKEKLDTLLQQEDIEAASKLALYRELPALDLGEEEEEMEQDQEEDTAQFPETFSEEEFESKDCFIRVKNLRDLAAGLRPLPPSTAIADTSAEPTGEEEEKDQTTGRKRKKSGPKLYQRVGFKTADMQQIEDMKSMRTCRKRHKMSCCKKCSGCRMSNCGTCLFCLDSTRFGGPGKLKQKCVLRTCSKPTLTMCPKCKWAV